MIKATIDTEKFVKELSKIHGGLHEATSRTVNDMSEITRDRYNKYIESEYNIRTNFTRTALKIYPSTFQRKSKPGQLRALRDIRALLFIRKLKGGKQHYLVIQEEGLSKDQHRTADDKVSIPTDASRSGGSFKGRVSPRLNLRRGINTLKIGGTRTAVRDFGTGRDGFTKQQRWAILNKYKKDGIYGWDLNTPFRLTYDGNTDAYAVKGGKIVMVRAMRQDRMKVKKNPLFEQAFGRISEAEMQSIFNKVASRLLR